MAPVLEDVKLGSAVKIEFTLYDYEGVLTRPTEYRALYAKHGAATVAEAAVTIGADGIGYFEFTPDSVGLWAVAVYVTRPGVVVRDGWIRVEAPIL